MASTTGPGNLLTFPTNGAAAMALEVLSALRPARARKMDDRMINETSRDASPCLLGRDLFARLLFWGRPIDVHKCRLRGGLSDCLQLLLRHASSVAGGGISTFAIVGKASPNRVRSHWNGPYSLGRFFASLSKASAELCCNDLKIAWGE